MPRERRDATAQQSCRSFLQLAGIRLARSRERQVSAAARSAGRDLAEERLRRPASRNIFRSACACFFGSRFFGLNCLRHLSSDRSRKPGFIPRPAATNAVARLHYSAWGSHTATTGSPLITFLTDGTECFIEAITVPLWSSPEYK